MTIIITILTIIIIITILKTHLVLESWSRLSLVVLSSSWLSCCVLQWKDRIENENQNSGASEENRNAYKGIKRKCFVLLGLCS